MGVRKEIELVPNMRVALYFIPCIEPAWTVKKCIDLIDFKFCPESIYDIVHRFIDHTKVETWLHLQIHNLLNLEMLWSCEHNKSIKSDFMNNCEGSDRNSMIIDQQVLPIIQCR